MEKDDYYPYKPGTSEEETDDFKLEEEKISTVSNPKIKEETRKGPFMSAPITKSTEYKQPFSAAKDFSLFLTVLTGPFIIPAVATLLVFRLSILALTGPSLATSYTLLVFGATCLLPVLMTASLKIMGQLKSLSLFNSYDRRGLYILMTVALGAVGIFFKFKSAPDWLWLIFTGATISCIVNFIINFKFKISCQATSLAALVAVFIAIQNDGLPHDNLGWWVIGTIILAGITGSLNVMTRRHSAWEVFAGYATGFLPIALLVLLFAKQSIIVI